MRPGSPIAVASRRRLASAASGSSPTWSPMLKLSNGAAETPPARVVVTRRMRTVTVPSIPALLPPVRSVAHERWHVDVIVVIAAAADAHRRPVRVHRHTRRVDRFEDRRGDLARLAGG